MRHIVPTSLLVLVCLLPASLPATQDLYTGEASLEPGQGADGAALRAAFGEVIVKLTGQPALADDPALLAAAGNPESMMLGYLFREYTLPMRDDEPREGRRLVAEFDPDMVNRLLADQNIARWGRERPEILVWTVFDTVDNGVRFGEAESDWLEPHLEEVGRRQGVSLISPLYDGMDRALVSTEDIRGGFTEPLLEYLPRYGADALVLVDFREVDPGWVANWVIRMGHQEERFVLRDESPEALVAQGVTRLTGTLARRFATMRSVDRDRQTLTVSGVRSPAHFAEVLRYLDGLSLVDGVQVRRAAGDSLQFELEVNAEGLEDVLALGGLLEYQSSDAAGELHYRLQW